MRGGYTIPGYFEDCQIKNNEVREKRSSKTLYYYKNKELKSSGFFGKTVLVFKNGGIYQPGLLGKKLFNVTKYGEVKNTGFLGKTVGAIPSHWVYGYEVSIKEIDQKSPTNQIPAHLKVDKGKINIDDKTTQYIYVKGDLGVVVTVTVDDEMTFEDVFLGEYNQVVSYYNFLEKYPVIKTFKQMREDDYPHFQFMKSGVKEVRKLHKELETNGFYDFANVKESLSTYTVADLNIIADHFNIDVKGKKQDIIEEMSSEIELKNLITYSKDIMMSISEKGKQYLKDNDLEVEYYYSSYYPKISLNEYCELRKNKTREDLEIDEINQEIKKDKKGWGRNLYYRRSGLNLSKGEHENALRDLLIVLRNDLSGVASYYSIMEFPNELEFRQPPSHIIFAPGLIRDILKLKDHYNESIIDQVYKVKLPLDATTKDLFIEVMDKMMSDNLDEDKYQKIFKERFSQVVSGIPTK